jgi:putative oxidoreductase
MPSRAAVDLAPLLLRLAIGTSFVASGLDKAAAPERAAALFRSLDLPSPELLGPVVGVLELVGGIALLVGLLTRFVSMVLAVEMAVVLVLVRASDVMAARSLVDAFVAVRLEVILALAAIALALIGSGRFALDAMIARFRGPPGEVTSG